MKTQSGTQLPIVQHYQNNLIISFNSVQKERQGMNGTEIYWECDQATISGLPTAIKIKEAVNAVLRDDEYGNVKIMLKEFKDVQKISYDNQIEAYKNEHNITILDPANMTEEERQARRDFLLFREQLQEFQESTYATKVTELESAAEAEKAARRELSRQIMLSVFDYLNNN